MNEIYAIPTLYLVDGELSECLKTGPIGSPWENLPQLKCVYRPQTLADCTGKGWKFVSIYAPLVHGTRKISIYHGSRDQFVALEEIDQLRIRPETATHVVSVVPIRYAQEPTPPENVPIPGAVREVLFFFAVRRGVGTGSDRLELFDENK